MMKLPLCVWKFYSLPRGKIICCGANKKKRTKLRRDKEDKIAVRMRYVKYFSPTLIETENFCPSSTLRGSATVPWSTYVTCVTNPHLTYALHGSNAGLEIQTRSYSSWFMVENMSRYVIRDILTDSYCISTLTAMIFWVDSVLACVPNIGHDSCFNQHYQWQQPLWLQIQPFSFKRPPLIIIEFLWFLNNAPQVAMATGRIKWMIRPRVWWWFCWIWDMYGFLYFDWSHLWVGFSFWLPSHALPFPSMSSLCIFQ